MTVAAGAGDPGRERMRASDADREVVLERLRRAHAEGRLATPEFYERLDAVYDAKTYGELDVVGSDLPEGLAPQAPRPPTPAPRPPAGGLLRQMPPALRGFWLVWGTVVGINVLIWALVTVGQLVGGDGFGYPWPIWVAGPWGVVLLGVTATWWFGRGDQPGGSDGGPGGRS